MKTKSDFVLEDKPISELIADAESYQQLRKNLLNINRPAKMYDDEKILIAQLYTNMSILYTYHKKGLLSKYFEYYEICRKTGVQASSKGSSLYIISWGSNDEMRSQFMSKICKILSKLSVDRIASTAYMADLYHNITEIIDGGRKSGIGLRQLDDFVFWNEIFTFYDAYWDNYDTPVTDGD